MKIIDIHTHNTLPQPNAIEAICIKNDTPSPTLEKGQLYSVGIHPWDTVDDITPDTFERLDRLAEDPGVAAVGECGIDLTPHGGPMFRQIQIFKHHIDLSERIAKPLVVHNVKSHDIIVGARKDLKPTQNWAIHGFRGKPEVAAMLIRCGCFLSFGELFNADTIRMVPADHILAETDNSYLSIEEIIYQLSRARGEDLSEIIPANTHRFLECVSKP